MKKKFLTGTSGWNYRHWKNVFYPAGLAQDKWLEYYVKFFNAVELNVTFYRLVKKSTFDNWYKRSPSGFNFAVKGSRYITHVRRLKDCAAPLKLLLKNAGALKEKLSVILWQLPPAFKEDAQRLENFCKILKKSGLRYAFKFRNPGWYNEEIYRILKNYNYSLCMASSGKKYPIAKEITADFLYLRFHGENGSYSSNYSARQLKQWASLVKKTPCKKVFAFFNNDARAYAVKNALDFRKFLA